MTHTNANNFLFNIAYNSTKHHDDYTARKETEEFGTPTKRPRLGTAPTN